MFSGSSSFLGGQSSRPGVSQPNTSLPLPQQQQKQLQQNLLSSDATGYSQNILQPNFTGYMQSQNTGLQRSQGQQNGSHFSNDRTAHQYRYPATAYPMPQLAQQYQAHGQTIPAPFQQAQPTGFAAMANSFKSTVSPPQVTRGYGSSKAKTGTKIPSIRLSFITAQDQAKFETLFKSAVGDEQTLSGDKSRDLLLRSKLDGNSLSQIWSLADTTRSGQLHFPEFALAMYLCNLRLVGKPLPTMLPENIKNEVSSMVDIINFGVVDEAAETLHTTTTPDFSSRLGAPSPPALQQPQPMQSNSALLTAQMTGFPGPQNHSSPISTHSAQNVSQQPGLAELGQIQSGMSFNTSSVQNVPNPSAIGYAGPRPLIPPTPTDYNQITGMSPSQTGTGTESMISPLNSQPTGGPGQWGLVNAPASGLPNIDLLQSRMMPQKGREQGSFTTFGLAGNAVIPWAVTKDEKTRYDSVFKAWDGFGKGFIGGDVAIEVFGQSGLGKSDLERVWNLADHGNKGRLNMDEFAVAMHLIYRKLNGYQLPTQLPPELIPPSTRNFNDSIGTVKSLLHRESDLRKSSGAGLLSQKTGVSYLKTHSFRSDSSDISPGRKDATVFRNNDDDVGYKSSARRRLGNSSPRPSSPSSTTSNDDPSFEQLKKKIREKQVLLDAIDFKDENAADEDDALDRRDRREANDLYRRIRHIQEDIDGHPEAVLWNIDGNAERRILKRKLQILIDKLPDIASEVRKTEWKIADAKLELFRVRDAKVNPDSASMIIGTGPGGYVTEADRLKARAKAMMQQRAAALTGKRLESNDHDADTPRRLEEENSKIKTEREDKERMVRDVEDSVREYSRGLEDSLKEGTQDSMSEHEKRRWEDGLGVEDEVKDFIFDLQRSSRSTMVRREDINAQSKLTSEPTTSYNSSNVAAVADAQALDSTSLKASSTYSQHKTPENRAVYIKQQAEKRMAERLAALGIKGPTKSGETTQQRLDREKSERAAKLRQAEEDDNKREAERQARINEERLPVPANTSEPIIIGTTRKPPPPPSRKAAKSDASDSKLEEQHVLEEQKAQILVTQGLQDDAVQQQATLAKERQASAARLKALEEQVKVGKMKKEEEKRRRKAIQAEAREHEARLAAQRAEIEAAQARERELQRQLEAIDDEDSSDDEDNLNGPEQITPQASTPTQGSQELERKEISPPPPSMPSSTQHIPQPATTTSLSASSLASESETKNPFLKKLAQVGADSSSPSTQSSTSNNPFHRIPPQEGSRAQEPLTLQLTEGRLSRARPEEDEWSVVGSDKDDDSSDEGGPGAGNARALASILFGTMGPPRPLSAMESGPESTPTSLAAAKDSPTFSTLTPPISAAPPPPPPPMPVFGGPPAPPSMPESSTSTQLPVATSNAISGGARPVALLGEIQMGKALRKTQTKDKSGAAVAGRVLD